MQTIRGKGDWEGWLKLFLRAVHEVAREATETARKIVNLRESHRDIITTKLKQRAGNGLVLLKLLYFNPIISVDFVMEATNLSFPNANASVKQFCDVGLLSEITGQKRNRRFSYSSYLNLFHDPGIENSKK